MRNAKRIAARIGRSLPKTVAQTHRRGAASKGVERGRHVDLEEKDDGNLEFTLTDEGRREIGDLQELPEDDAMSTLLEDHLGSGWEWIAPEEIGALTSALILTREAERDDQGQLERVGRVYWDSDYQTRSTVEELAKSGRATWTGAE